MKLSQSVFKGLRFISVITLTIFLSTEALADNKSDKHAEKKKSDNPIEVYIIEPLDGAIVSSPFTVKFGLKGMNVAPAGSDMKNSGHHHLLIDTDEIPKKGIPMSNNVMHFGKGQTETKLILDKGVHTLQLIMGDKYHIPMAEMVISKKISITVK